MFADSSLPFGTSRILELCNGFDAPLSEVQLRHVLEQLGKEDQAIISLAQFDNRRYKRRSLFKSKALELLVMGWLPGQATPLHDHGSSLCGVKVLSGRGFELGFNFSTDQILVPSDISHIKVGDLIVSTCDTIHQVGNASDVPLVSLHVYTPPLENVNWYSTRNSVLNVEPLNLEPALPQPLNGSTEQPPSNL